MTYYANYHAAKAVSLFTKPYSHFRRLSADFWWRVDRQYNYLGSCSSVFLLTKQYHIIILDISMIVSSRYQHYLWMVWS